MSFNDRSRQAPKREEEEAGRLAKKSTAPKPRRLRKIIVVSIVVLVILALVGFIYGLYTTDDKTHYWAVTRDIVRALSSVIVLHGAWAVCKTSHARSRQETAREEEGYKKLAEE